MATRWLAVAAMSLVLQRNGLARQVPTLRTQTDLVALNVTVLDDRDKYVTGLRQSQFAVTEDGEPRDIEHFAEDPAPLSLVIAMDASESMKGQRWSLAQEAVLRFF